MHSQGWKDEYLQIINQMVAEGDTIYGVADRLDLLKHEVEDILARTHPLGPVLQSWAARSAAPGRGWTAFEYTNP